jgi:hypothetical protein
MEKETVSYNMQTYDVLGNERSNAVENLEKMDLDTGGAIKKLAVALGVDWNAANADKSVTLLKERIIHLLGGHLGEGEEPTRETYTGLTVNMGKPAETSDYEDTREKLEEDVREEIGHYFSWQATRDQLSAKTLDFLDRQAAITEREVREALEQTISAAAEEAEQAFNDTRRLSATIEKQRDVIARAKVAYDTVRGLFDEIGE